MVILSEVLKSKIRNVSLVSTVLRAKYLTFKNFRMFNLWKKGVNSSNVDKFLQIRTLVL